MTKLITAISSLFSRNAWGVIIFDTSENELFKLENEIVKTHSIVGT